MPSDYGRITEENIEEYGKGTRHLAFLGRLYTDRTHFVYELLQNAEDAAASTVRFNLYTDRLEVLHDGRPFDERDVRGVCGVGEGTKADDLTQIGKFGIGFKSVYAYTVCPRIHSGDEHFCIEHYVRPTGIKPYAPGSPWTTAFLFRFDRPEISANQAFEEIAGRLGGISARSLLFLSNISSISWRVQGASTGQYIRDDVPWPGPGRRLRLTESLGQTVQEADWLVFDRAVEIPTGDTVRVEAAFAVSEDDASGILRIHRVEQTHLVVFFPTEKETHLGFLIQGPYQTTPARDNVPPATEWNRALVRETTTLVLELLPAMRDAGLLTVSLLQTLPVTVGDFPPEGMFRPLYDGVRSALRAHALLPTRDGRYAAAHEVKLASATGLDELLGPDQLGLLLGSERSLFWLDPDITLDRVPALYRYFVGYRPSGRDQADAIEPLIESLRVDGDTIASRLNEGFLRQQDDEWLVRLYAFLGSQRATWSAVKRKPILRLQDRSHVAPFDSTGRPMAYLPPNQTTSMPIVHREIAKHPEALEFLRALGLEEPDLTTEVIENILPKYELGSIEDVGWAEHEEDIDKIAAVLSTAAGPSRDRLIARLRETPFMRGENARSGAAEFMLPRELYRRDDDLELYFDRNPECWFLDENWSLVRSFAEECGVRHQVRVTVRQADYLGFVIVRQKHSDHVRGVDDFDPDCEVDGLAHALGSITAEKAAYIWNGILMPNRQQIRGLIQRSRSQNYTAVSSHETYSRMGELVTRKAWIPVGERGFNKPQDVNPDDLPLDFQRDDMVTAALGMKIPELESAARAVGMSVDDIRFLREHTEEFKRFRVAVERRREHGESEGDELEATPVTSHLDFAAALQQEFSRPGESKLKDAFENIASGVRDPEVRRRRIAEEIARAQEHGRLKRRFTVVARSRWETKDSSTRVFLTQEYGGRCQVCDSDPFPKADGTPYFEGLYLVPRIQEAWLDRPGNVLSLCPVCCAKLQFGAVEADSLVDQILAIPMLREGGKRRPILEVTLLGERSEIRFTERHLLDLQEMIKASQKPELQHA